MALHVAPQVFARGKGKTEAELLKKVNALRVNGAKRRDVETRADTWREQRAEAMRASPAMQEALDVGRYAPDKQSERVADAAERLRERAEECADAARHAVSKADAPGNERCCKATIYETIAPDVADRMYVEVRTASTCSWNLGSPCPPMAA